MKLKTLLFIILIIFLVIILTTGNSNNQTTKKDKIQVEKEIVEKNDRNEIDKIYADKLNNIDKNIEKENTKEDNKKEEIKFKCPTPEEDYPDMSLLNIGQDVSLPETKYIPKNLEELSLSFAIREKLCLTKETKEAFEEMAKIAKEDKINIKISSAFRSYSYQAMLFNNSEKDKNGNSLSTAKPGYSEHQLGTTIDITGSSINYSSASDSFGGTKEDNWLLNNSYLYGFVQSYPYKKENITGYRYEPWHYRYIGKEKATEMKKLDLTLKEYLAK